MVLGESGNFHLWGVDLGHCATPPVGVNSPWRMFPNDFYLLSGSTGPLKSNRKLITTKTEHFLKMTQSEVF